MHARKRTGLALAGLVALAGLAGCVREPNVASRSAAILEIQETGQMPEGAGHEHGATTSSSEAVQSGQPAKTLSPDPLDAPAGTSVMDAQRSAEMAEGMAGGGGHDSHHGHGGHGGTGTYRHVDVGRGPGAYEGSESQTPGAEPHHHHGAEGAGETAATLYVCPMHPEVTSNEPGTCSKCGMALVERREE